MSVKYNVVDHGTPGDPSAPKKYYLSAIASGKMNQAVAKRAADISRMFQSVASDEVRISQGYRGSVQRSFMVSSPCLSTKIIRLPDSLLSLVSGSVVAKRSQQR